MLLQPLGHLSALESTSGSGPDQDSAKSSFAHTQSDIFQSQSFTVAPRTWSNRNCVRPSNVLRSLTAVLLRRSSSALTIHVRMCPGAGYVAFHEGFEGERPNCFDLGEVARDIVRHCAAPERHPPRKHKIVTAIAVARCTLLRRSVLSNHSWKQRGCRSLQSHRRTDQDVISHDHRRRARARWPVNPAEARGE